MACELKTHDNWYMTILDLWGVVNKWPKPGSTTVAPVAEPSPRNYMIFMARRRLRRFRQFISKNIPAAPTQIYTGFSCDEIKKLSVKKPTQPTNRRFPMFFNDLVASVPELGRRLGIDAWILFSS